MRSFVRGHEFGTAPVFLASISTILGAVLFLRFGYAVGNVGLAGALLIVLIGHLITVPTALAVSEIATNRRIEGGGEYFIISRSFGPLVGGTIGIALYISQAISVAFYMIAFSMAFTPLFSWFQNLTGISPDPRMISIPATLLLLLIILKKGADVGVATLWVVVSILGLSLLLFFLGPGASGSLSFKMFKTVEDPDSLFKVFAIVFPAFTGMTAGVGLSGDLKDPRRSIPLGTLSATLTGMLVYVLVIFKLVYSATPQELVSDQLIMSRIALWGPIIPIGLAAATISSAIGSILIAPRTMQALAGDRVFPLTGANRFLGSGRGESNEPVNALLVTSAIVLTFVAMGSVDFVAQIITMFFMITYGMICLVSVLENFAGNISYRPTFRTRWYFSLVGAIACLTMMLKISSVYTYLAMLSMGCLYFIIKHGHAGEYGLSAMVKGVLFQLTRKLQVLIQREQAEAATTSWRPSYIAISPAPLANLAPFNLLRWFSHHYGFGTFVHFIKGELNEKTREESKRRLEKLVELGAKSHASIYVDTIVSPSFKNAVSHIVQMPGISGMENNSVLFYSNADLEGIEDIVEGCSLAAVAGYNISVFCPSNGQFGRRRKIHIWLTPGDYRNSNLMILLGYVLMEHPEWKGCEIEIFAAFKEKEMKTQVEKLNQLIELGRIPISRKHIKKVSFKAGEKSFKDLVLANSGDADLIIRGFSLEKVRRDGGRFFKQFSGERDVLFVRAGQRIVIGELSGEREGKVLSSS